MREYAPTISEEQAEVEECSPTLTTLMAYQAPGSRVATSLKYHTFQRGHYRGGLTYSVLPLDPEARTGSGWFPVRHQKGETLSSHSLHSFI